MKRHKPTKDHPWNNDPVRKTPQDIRDYLGIISDDCRDRQHNTRAGGLPKTPGGFAQGRFTPERNGQ